MNIKHHIALLAACVLATGVISCKTESDDAREKVAPHPITSAEFTPTNGGGYIKYVVPDDEDFLYVRAEYTIDNGQVISRSSSVYTDSMYISGFGSVKPYEVKLYACDYFANESEPYSMTVTPLEANVYAVANTVRVRAGFANIVIDLENPARESVDVYVDLAAQDGSGRKATRIFTSSAKSDKLLITGLESIPYSVTTYVKDKYENGTAPKDEGVLTPLSDYELSKEQWTWLRDDYIYGSNWDKSKNKPTEEYMGMYTSDSMKNAMEYRFEASIYKFWDGILDSGDDKKLNMVSFFHSGTNYPFSYFINMGRKVKISRMRIHQRYDYRWTTYGPKVIDLYISNDQNPADGIFDWEFLGRYTLEKPALQAEADQEFLDGSEFWIYPAEAAFSPAFRYLRFKCVTDFTGKGTIGCLAELTLYGEDC